LYSDALFCGLFCDRPFAIRELIYVYILMNMHHLHNQPLTLYHIFATYVKCLSVIPFCYFRYTAGMRFIFIIIVFVLTEVALVFTPVSALDIPLEVYVAGGLTMTLNGALASGINFGNVDFSDVVDAHSSWNSSDSADYIAFADNTSKHGFYITMDMTDFNYTGSSTDQLPIPNGNFKLTGEYADGAAAPATKGYNDTTKTVNILPDSCARATTDTYTFHNDLLDQAKNYAITGSTAAQVLVQSKARCLNIGELRFDMASLTVPANSAIGSYSSTLTFTIFDGKPGRPDEDEYEDAGAP